MTENIFNTVYLLIGANIGDRMRNLQQSKKLIGQHLGRIIINSSIYQTAAWGNNDQPDFLNQVLIVNTLLSAEECLQNILAIENMMGRIRTEKNAPRIIDIDILFYNNIILNIPGLIIPHPEIQNRRFVLMPLNEISSSFIHPVLNKTIKSVLTACKDQLEVRMIRDTV